MKIIYENILKRRMKKIEIVRINGFKMFTIGWLKIFKKWMKMNFLIIDKFSGEIKNILIEMMLKRENFKLKF